MPDQSPHLHLAAALDGAGWHPAAGREPGARPEQLFTAGYWAGLVAEAEHGLLNLVTIEDSLSLQSERFDGPDGRADRKAYRPVSAGQLAFQRRLGVTPVFPTLEDFVARSSALIGSPQQIIDKVHHYHDQFGHSVLHLHADAGGLTDAQHVAAAGIPAATDG